MYKCLDCGREFRDEVGDDCPICGRGLIETGNDNLDYWIQNEREFW